MKSKANDFLKNAVWKLSRLTRLDYLLARFSSPGSLLRKGLPRHTHYQNESYTFPVTSKLALVIDRSDYTQWKVFAGSMTIHPVLKKALKDLQHVTIFDIGANIGAYSALLVGETSAKTVDVHLFEPNPAIYKILEKNVEALMQSRSGMKCFAVNKAIGEKNEQLTLKVQTKHSGASSLLGSDHASDSVQVDVISLDQYVESRSIQNLHFIKIDVESFEPSVFHGSFKTISRFKPVLYFEYSQAWFNHFSEQYIAEIFGFLNAAGYVLFLEQPGNLEKLSSQQLRDVKFANIFAIQSGFPR